VAQLDWLGRAPQYAAMSNPALILRRANVSRKGGRRQNEDYDVFDGGRRDGWKSMGGNDHQRRCLRWRNGPNWGDGWSRPPGLLGL